MKTIPLQIVRALCGALRNRYLRRIQTLEKDHHEATLRIETLERKLKSLVDVRVEEIRPGAYASVSVAIDVRYANQFPEIIQEAGRDVISKLHKHLQREDVKHYIHMETQI